AIVSRPAVSEVLVARRVRVHRRDPADIRREISEDGSSRTFQELPAGLTTRLQNLRSFSFLDGNLQRNRTAYGVLVSTMYNRAVLARWRDFDVMPSLEERVAYLEG